MEIRIYKVWFQKKNNEYHREICKDEQVTFGGKDDALSYAKGISGNSEITFVTCDEYISEDGGMFNIKENLYEYGKFDPLSEWAYVG